MSKSTPTFERWDQNGYVLDHVIIVRDGPDKAGRYYCDGRHSVTVAQFESIADAEMACREHNAHAALVEALQLLQGQAFQLQDDATGREIKRRVLAALRLAAPADGDATHG